MSQPIINLGENAELDENADGEPVIRHVPSGAEFRYDKANGAWHPAEGLGSDANPVPSGVFGSVTAESATADSVNAEVLQSAVFPDGTDAGSIRDARDKAGEGGVIGLKATNYLIDTYETVDTGVEFGVPLLPNQTVISLGATLTLEDDAPAVTDGDQNRSVLGNEDPVNGDENIYILGDLTVDGNRATQSNASGDWECVNFKNVDGVGLMGVKTQNASADGFDFDYCTDINGNRLRAVDNGKDGYHPSSNCQDVTFNNCISKRNGQELGGYGYSTVDTVEEATFNHCKSINDRVGWRVDGQTQLDGCRVESPDLQAVVTDQGVKGESQIDGGYYEASPGENAIDLSQGDHVDSIEIGAEIKTSDNGKGIVGLPSRSTVAGSQLNGNGRAIECASGADRVAIHGNRIGNGGFYRIDLNGATDSSVTFNSVFYLESDTAQDAIRNAGTGTETTPNTVIYTG